LNNFVLIAKIISIYGKKGFLKLNPVSDFENLIERKQRVFIDVFGDFRKFYVAETKESENFLAIKFENFDSSDEVKFLLGKDILLPAEEVKSSFDDVFLSGELIGLRVFRNGKFFGKVLNILNLKANDVLVIMTPDMGEVLIPFVDALIKKIDMDAKRIDLIDGEGDLFDVAD
jgi:16S rRNA processing protein RimM